MRRSSSLLEDVVLSQGNSQNRPGRGRVLGVDVGERRVGLALSDSEGRLAVPLRSVTSRAGAEEEVLAAIARLAAEEEVVEVVVGLPLSLSGEAGPQAERASAFARRLQERLRLPVHLWDERLSTREAQARSRDTTKGGPRVRRRSPSVDIDALAAAIILQAYLDRQRAG